MTVLRSAPAEDSPSIIRVKRPSGPSASSGCRASCVAHTPSAHLASATRCGSRRCSRSTPADHPLEACRGSSENKAPAAPSDRPSASTGHSNPVSSPSLNHGAPLISMGHRVICGCFPRTSVEAHTSGCRILKEGSSHEALCRIGPVDGKHAGLHH